MKKGFKKLSKTKFNRKMTELLNNTIDDVDIARIKSIIGEKEFVFSIIDEEWLEQQYIGDGIEYSHPRFGTVNIEVEVNILDIIGNNVLIENKRTYTGKYNHEVHEIIIYFFGPIDEELLQSQIEQNSDS